MPKHRDRNPDQQHGTTRDADSKLPFSPLKRVDGSLFNCTRSLDSLVVRVLREYCPRWTPGALAMCVRKRNGALAVMEYNYLRELGIKECNPLLVPDAAVYYKQKDWLVLIESTTRHGPISPTRHQELKILFKGSKATLVFVSAFLSREGMTQHLDDIAWETTVWVAETPAHLIHFNGKQLCGPYENAGSRRARPSR